MKKLLIILFVLFSFAVVGQDTLRTHSTLVPLKGEQPTMLGTEKIDTSTLFIVNVYKDSLIVQFGYKSMELRNLQELDTLIKNNFTKIEKQYCSIKTSNKHSYNYKRVQDVIDIFTKNNIKKFDLISN